MTVLEPGKPSAPDAPRARKGSLRPVRPKGPRLRFQYNPTQVRTSGGVGGWRSIERPRDEPATEWESVPGRYLSFPLIFDGYSAQRLTAAGPGSVQEEYRYLRRLGESSKGSRPPVLEFDYGPVGRGDLWVMQDLTEEEERRNRSLDLVFIVVNITLMRFVSSEVTLTPTDKHRRKSTEAEASRNRVYVAAAGDTLSSISARLLGDASRWPELARLNGIRDPERVTRGMTLRLPIT